MTPEHARRACARSQKYPNQGKARLAIRKQAERGTVAADDLNVRRCKCCGGWHVYRSRFPSRGAA